MGHMRERANDENVEFVKGELRRTRTYLQDIFRYQMKKLEMESVQANLRSPSLSNSGGQHNGSSSFDLLDYTDEIEQIGKIIKLYQEKVAWNGRVVMYASARLQTVLLDIYIYGKTIEQEANSQGLSKDHLRKMIEKFFEETVAVVNVDDSLNLSNHLKKALKDLYEVRNQRKIEKQMS